MEAHDENGDIAGEVAEEMKTKLVFNGEYESSGNENLRNLEGEFDEAGGEGEDDDFTFACYNPDEASAILADDAFHNGQIRPMYPLFNREFLFSDDSTPSKNDLPTRPPVRKVFVEARDPPPRSPSEAEETSGPYCPWSKKAVEASSSSSSSSEACKKCNSTGFSKVWRFRDLVNRSNSDGRDAFVFLNGSAAKRADKKSSGEAKAKVSGSGGKVVEKKKGGGKVETTSPAHQLRHMRNRATRDVDRRRSYLPYRPELVGFFTNVNGGMSRNVHPF